jgi:hypothetical protein
MGCDIEGRDLDLYQLINIQIGEIFCLFGYVFGLNGLSCVSERGACQ